MVRRVFSTGDIPSAADFNGLAQVTELAAAGGSSMVGHDGSLNYVADTIGAVLLDACLNVRMFPWLAKGDGVTDDTAAVQAAINRAKALGKALFWPAGTYLVTQSLDCTFADNASANFIMFGEGKMRTIIKGVLTEQYPIVDYTGNTRGELRDIQVLSQGAGSQATTAFLSAKPQLGGSRGNTVTVRDCLLSVPNTGNAYAVVGAVFFNTDLSKAINSEFYGPGGAIAGFGKPAAVTSKFQTISAQLDSTLFVFENCALIGDSRPGVEYTGGAAIAMRSVYLALIGGGTALDAFKVSDQTGSAGNAIYADGFRTENQSSSTEFYSVNLSGTMRSFGGHIEGAIDTNWATSAAIRGGASASLSQFRLNLAATLGNKPMFSGGLLVEDNEIVTNMQLLGVVAAASHNNSFVGEMPQAQAQLGNLRNMTRKDGSLYLPGDLKVSAPGSINIPMRVNGNWLQRFPANSYTGGSGEQQIDTFTIPAGLLMQPNGAAKVNTVIRFLGDMVAANAGGRVRIRLRQGANSWFLLDHNGIPAGAGSFEIAVTLANVSTNGMYASVLSAFGSSPLPQFSPLWGGTPEPDMTQDMQLDFLETNTGNNGIRPRLVIGRLE